MSFLGVKVILFLVIPLIIKEKSNASALSWVLPDLHLAFTKFIPCFRQTLTSFSPHYLFVFIKPRRGFLCPSWGRYSWYRCKLCAFLFG